MSEPIPVEAIQYDGSNAAAVATWTGLGLPTLGPGEVKLPLSSGGTDYVALPSDWVVRVAPGVYVVCTDRLFADTYTAV